MFLNNFHLEVNYIIWIPQMRAKYVRRLLYLHIRHDNINLCVFRQANIRDQFDLAVVNDTFDC